MKQDRRECVQCSFEHHIKQGIKSWIWIVTGLCDAWELNASQVIYGLETFLVITGTWSREGISGVRGTCCSLPRFFLPLWQKDSEGNPALSRKYLIVLRWEKTYWQKVKSVGWEDPLEESMATNPGILAWRVPWTEEAGRLWHRVTKSQTQLKQLSAHTHEKH